MRKPVIYYHFDLEKYRSEHYAEGWYDYNHGLGMVTQTEKECVDEIEKSIKNNFAILPQYLQYADSLFPYRDNNNCERVYDAICKIEKNKRPC
jgi:CDP-glycerol glycerophosphotransferase (TagB/SpsB family)